MSVTLFYPDTGTREIALPPFSLLAIGSCLETKGFHVKIIDARVDRDYREKICNTSSNSFFFGVSSMTGPQIKGGLEAAKLVRGKSSQIPIVWGGFHPTFLPIQALKHPLVDIVVKGQGEVTALELAERLEAQRDLEDVKGILYKKNGRIIATEERSIEDMNNFPPMNYGLVDVEKYIVHDVSPRTVAYFSSRGCVHRCGFCAISKFYGRQWSGLKPERVVNEIENLLESFRIDGIKFLDDNFFVDRNRVKQICNLLVERGLDIKWNASARCDYICSFNSNMLAAMRKSGCHTIEFGAESGSEKILNLISKDITVKDILTSAKICRQYGFIAAYSFMMGFPTETQNDLKETMKLMDQLQEMLPAIEMNMFIYTPYPATPLYDLAIQNRFKPPENLEEWSRFTHNNVVVPWLNGKHKNFLEELSLLSWFAFTPSLQRRLKSKHLKFLYSILQRLALYRWNRRFFNIPIEWEIIKHLAGV